MLLQTGAKWNSDTLLDEQKTPYHVICESKGDHHELLDLMTKSSQKRIIDKQDTYKHTSLVKAARNNNMNCIKTMIEKGARLDMSTDEYGLSVLWYVTNTGNVKDVRYILEQGVAIPNYAPDVKETHCDRCKEKMLVIDDEQWDDDYHEIEDPCRKAIVYKDVEIVKLLDKHGSQSGKSLNALRHAVLHLNMDVVSYLLSKYKYPLNIEYVIEQYGWNRSNQRYTLLTDPDLAVLFGTSLPVFNIIKLLLDHGADPAKQMCGARSVNALMTAIEWRNLKVIVQYIRSGVNINFRSYDCRFGKVLPFEAAVMRGYHDVAEMFLIPGCSCGQFSLDNNCEDKPELIKEWKVQENNVIPLKLRCRSVILNHLSPRADMKIEKLPLPGLLIKLLSVPELDAMLDL